MKQLFKNKKFLAVYLIWVLLHTFLFLQNLRNGRPEEGFWPFSDYGLYSYDISEWLVYVFAPLVIIFLFIAFNDERRTITILLLFLSIGLSAKGQLRDEFLQVPSSPIIEQSPVSAQNNSLYYSQYSSFKEEIEAIDKEYPNPKPPEFDSGLDSEAINISFEDWNRAMKYRSDLVDKKITEARLRWSYQDSIKKAQEEQITQIENNRRQEEQQKIFEQIMNTQQPSLGTQLAPEHFNYEKTNADRFVHSPCYSVLGFNPDADPLAQEEKYRSCEEGNRIEQMKYGGTIIGIFVAIILLVLFGISIFKKSELKETI